jgi:hypothetical protein
MFPKGGFHEEEVRDGSICEVMTLWAEIFSSFSSVSNLACSSTYIALVSCSMSDVIKT